MAWFPMTSTQFVLTLLLIHQILQGCSIFTFNEISLTFCLNLHDLRTNFRFSLVIVNEDYSWFGKAGTGWTHQYCLIVLDGEYVSIPHPMSNSRPPLKLNIPMSLMFNQVAFQIIISSLQELNPIISCAKSSLDGFLMCYFTRPCPFTRLSR